MEYDDRGIPLPRLGPSNYDSTHETPSLQFCRHCGTFKDGGRSCSDCGAELRIIPIYRRRPSSRVHSDQPERGITSRIVPPQCPRDQDQTDNHPDRTHLPNRPSQAQLEAPNFENGQRKSQGTENDPFSTATVALDESIQLAKVRPRAAGIRWCNQCCVATHWTTEVQYHCPDPPTLHQNLLNESVPRFVTIWKNLKAFRYDDDEWEDHTRLQPENRRELINHLYKMVVDIVNRYRAWVPLRDSILQGIREQAARHKSSELIKSDDDGHIPWDHYSAKANHLTLRFLSGILQKVQRFFDDHIVKKARVLVKADGPNTSERQLLQEVAAPSDANATGAFDWTAVVNFIDSIEDSSKEYTNEILELNKTWLTIVASEFVMALDLREPESTKILSLPFVTMRARFDRYSSWLPTFRFLPLESLSTYCTAPNTEADKTVLDTHLTQTAESTTLS